MTTHYPEVKEYAARTDGILNARMPNDMLRVAIRAAYGENAVDSYHFCNAESIDASHPHAKLQMAKKPKHAPELSTKFAIGDSVMLYPDDYDFSILFDSVENRKKRHDMQRKYTDNIIETDS